MCGINFVKKHKRFYIFARLNPACVTQSGRDVVGQETRTGIDSMKIKIILITILLCWNFVLNAQRSKNNDHSIIKWTGIKNIKVNETDSVSFISFDGAFYIDNLPYYFEKIKIESNYSYSAKISDQVFEECTKEEMKVIKTDALKSEIIIQSSVTPEKKQPYLCVSFFPFRINSSTGKIEKLVSFKIEPVQGQAIANAKQKLMYAQNSVLSSGKWYKIAVTDNKVYKLTYDNLLSLGIDVASVDPKNIRIYGNGGGMLPEENNKSRYDDLVENSIFVKGESDGVFDNTDYILFYGESPVKWKYSSNDKKFHHQANYYSNYTYYFISTDLGSGKRISQQSSTTQPANKFITKFNDYACHEKDSINLIKSGKEWYGENFDILTSYSFNFTFPNIDGNSMIFIQSDIAGKYTSPNYYTVNANGHSYTTVIGGVSGLYEFAAAKTDTMSFFSGSSNINVTVTKTTSNAIGWMNYIELNATRDIILSNYPLSFRSITSVGLGNISEYTVSNAGSGVKIWEVTNPLDAKEQQFTLSGNNAVFRLSSDTLREFVAFNGMNFSTPILAGKFDNQNLHALGQTDLIIVSHPDFLSEAYRIAGIHSANDNLSSVVVTPDQIYNEFSSGSQDVSAIRDFVKMFYDRAGTDIDKMPKYLLLFGDGSYDYKNRLSDNSNYVPTFQSPNGLNMTASYASDDFYGFLDDNEGPYVNSLLDIGIGRFPVKTIDEAKVMADKVTHYIAKHNPNSGSSGCSNYSAIASGDWRNLICIIADDEESNDFVISAENFADYIDTTYNNYNLEKIYCDAYVQETGAGGQRYPDVNDAINKRVEKGALIINYIGHGGEVGWALERILQISDIQDWTNINNMPLFLTATCEFSRFDDPERTSAGELVLLNQNGGGIALFTTSRLAYNTSNSALNMRFYQNAFKKINGSFPTLGQLTMLSKNAGLSVDPSIRNFVLLGDPALKLSYPENTAATTSINGHPANTVYDTLKAFDKITVSGEIQDPLGQKLTNFNGVIYQTVYDKKALTATLGNDPSSYITNFYTQKSILYKGKASVTNGDFSFTFIVPKDIAYNYGIGRISYYAEDGVTDANGFYENKYFIIGGSNTNHTQDNTGPGIKLYLNDTNFVFGGITDEKPLLLAYVSDSNGINTVGNGIGHDIVAVLDENTTKSISLNDYYEADLNSYQRGAIRYPFKKLSDGTHTLRLKVWDIYNNSSEVSTEFVVAQSAQLALSHVLNYPNPFTTHTAFFFEHNHPCCALDVQIQIFTITGRLIKTIDQSVQTMGYRAEPIPWDGLDDFGDPIGRGVYIYKLKVKNDDNSMAEKTEKLVILR